MQTIEIWQHNIAYYISPKLVMKRMYCNLSKWMRKHGLRKCYMTLKLLYMYSKDQLAEILRQYEYPDFLVDKTVERLNNMQPEIKSLFDKWLLNSRMPEDEIKGFTFRELTGEKFNFTPINAFLTLNWLLVDPANAIAALEGGIR